MGMEKIMNQLQQDNFRTPRYTILNQVRWEAFLRLGISLEGKTVFEPAAGIGDQTERYKLCDR